MDKIKSSVAYTLQRLNHKKTENLNRPIMSSEIRSVIKRFPSKQSSETNGFSAKFNKIFK
jgi:hypothetical protein